MSTREAAIVESVSIGSLNNNGVFTFYLYMDLSGSHQAFGGIVLKGDTIDKSEALKSELCEFFGVDEFEKIKGRNCFVLRCFDGWGEDIEGVEIDGKHWTLTGFCRRHFTNNFKSPLERRTKSLHSRINSYGRHIEHANQELETLASRYVDWEKP